MRYGLDTAEHLSRQSCLLRTCQEQSYYHFIKRCCKSK